MPFARRSDTTQLWGTKGQAAADAAYLDKAIGRIPRKWRPLHAPAGRGGGRDFRARGSCIRARGSRGRSASAPADAVHRCRWRRPARVRFRFLEGIAIRTTRRAPRRSGTQVRSIRRDKRAGAIPDDAHIAGADATQALRRLPGAT